MTRTVRTGAALGIAVLLGAAAARPAAAQSLLDRLRQAANVARTLLPISTAKEIEIGRGIAATIAGRFPVSTDTALTRYVNLVGPHGRQRGAARRHHLPVRRARDAHRQRLRGARRLHLHHQGRARPDSQRGGVGGRARARGRARQPASRHRADPEVGHHARGTERRSTSRAPCSTGWWARAPTCSSPASAAGTSWRRTASGSSTRPSAGYDPGGLAAFISRLDQHAGEGPLSEFFATHPKPNERVERLTAIARREGLTGGATLAERYQENIK